MEIFRLLVLLSSLIGICSAGIKTLNANEEAEVWDMFMRICSRGYNGEEGYDNNGIKVHCKLQDEPIMEMVTHPPVDVKVGNGKPPVLFVRPPPVTYIHKIKVKPIIAQGDRAKIYVLPQEATHRVTPITEDASNPQQKPAVYFLKSRNGNAGGPPTNTGPNPSRPTIPRMPPAYPSYGPPMIQSYMGYPDYN